MHVVGLWESPCIDYLRLIPEKGIRHMDHAKIAGTVEWPTPTMVKQVQSFLGFCNYYKPFIYQYSHVTKPVTDTAENPYSSVITT